MFDTQNDAHAITVADLNASVLGETPARVNLIGFKGRLREITRMIEGMNSLESTWDRGPGIIVCADARRDAWRAAFRVIHMEIRSKAREGTALTFFSFMTVEELSRADISSRLTEAHWVVLDTCVGSHDVAMVFAKAPATHVYVRSTDRLYIPGHPDVKCLFCNVQSDLSAEPPARKREKPIGLSLDPVDPVEIADEPAGPSPVEEKTFRGTFSITDSGIRMSWPQNEFFAKGTRLRINVREFRTSLEPGRGPYIVARITPHGDWPCNVLSMTEGLRGNRMTVVRPGVGAHAQDYRAGDLTTRIHPVASSPAVFTVQSDGSAVMVVESAVPLEKGRAKSVRKEDDFDDFEGKNLKKHSRRNRVAIAAELEDLEIDENSSSRQIGESMEQGETDVVDVAFFRGLLEFTWRDACPFALHSVIEVNIVGSGRVDDDADYRDAELEPSHIWQIALTRVPENASVRADEYAWFGPDRARVVPRNDHYTVTINAWRRLSRHLQAVLDSNHEISLLVTQVRTEEGVNLLLRIEQRAKAEKKGEAHITFLKSQRAAFHKLRVDIEALLIAYQRQLHTIL